MKELKLSDLFNKDLIFTDYEADSSTDLLNKLYKEVYRKGYVKNTFINGIIEREKNYPTGLETMHIKIAIPHTDAIHVNKSCITIAKLKHPVAFKNMATSVDDVNVEMVFMLAVHEPKEQVKVLQKIIGIFTNEEAMKKFKMAKTPDELLSIVFESVVDK